MHEAITDVYNPAGASPVAHNTVNYYNCNYCNYCNYYCNYKLPQRVSTHKEPTDGSWGQTNKANQEHMIRLEL